MGISAAIMGITAGISAASEIYKGVEGEKSATATQQALQSELKQTESQTRAKQIQNLERVNSTMGSQMVVGAANGYDLSSTSFNAVTADTMDKYEQDRNANALSQVYKSEAIDQQISNSKAQGQAALFGGITGAVGEGINLFGNELGGAMQESEPSSGSPIPQIGINYQQYQQSSLFKGVQNPYKPSDIFSGVTI